MFTFDSKLFTLCSILFYPFFQKIHLTPPQEPIISSRVHPMIMCTLYKFRPRFSTPSQIAQNFSFFYILSLFGAIFDVAHRLFVFFAARREASVCATREIFFPSGVSPSVPRRAGACPPPPFSEPKIRYFPPVRSLPRPTRNR